MNVNPIELLQMIKNGSNPERLMLTVLEQRMQNNPVGANLISMAKNGNVNGIEAFARNMCAQRGLDYDKEFTSFKKNFGL